MGGIAWRLSLYKGIPHGILDTAKSIYTFLSSYKGYDYYGFSLCYYNKERFLSPLFEETKTELYYQDMGTG